MGNNVNTEERGFVNIQNVKALFLHCQVPKEVVGKSFYHRWEDGWTACVSVEKVDCREAQKIERKSDGFCGYDWMIESIIKYGEIRYRRDWE